MDVKQLKISHFLLFFKKIFRKGNNEKEFFRCRRNFRRKGRICWSLKEHRRRKHSTINNYHFRLKAGGESRLRYPSIPSRQQWMLPFGKSPKGKITRKTFYRRITAARLKLKGIARALNRGWNMPFNRTIRQKSYHFLYKIIF